MRLDLGRNTDFLHELAFVHLTNGFISYCSDILSVAALGSPEKFDLSIRLQPLRLLRAKTSTRIINEISIAIVSRITAMNYPELKKLLLSKIQLKKGDLQIFEVIDRGIRTRNFLTHRRGISNLALDIHETGRWRKSEKVADAELTRLWRSISKLSRAIDVAIMRDFDVWRGADICAPGLYRKKGGRLIRADEQGAYD
jgi:hypothetical protein